jgi:[ribosomal protein S5]-alanine N-acetyltransferase
MCSDSVAEIGYSLMPSVQHQGDGTDCARTLINYLFYQLQLQLHTIQAITDPENKPPLSLLTRSGFILISFIPKATNIRGVLCDDAIYQLSLQDWEENLHKP